MTAKKIESYCEAEFENIDTILKELHKVLKAEGSTYTLAELAAIATYLPNTYNGLENILKRTVTHQGHPLPKTETWHKDLLNLSLEKGTIDADLHKNLLTLLSFRHYFVHSYVFSLEWPEIKPLVEKIDGTFFSFKNCILQAIKEETNS